MREKQSFCRELENMRTMKELKALFAFVESLLSSATLHWFNTLACMPRYILVTALLDFGFMGLRAKRGLDGVNTLKTVVTSRAPAVL